MDGRGDTVLKLRVMQFLSRINNGDKLGERVIYMSVCVCVSDVCF